jgi:hypothetical protein
VPTRLEGGSENPPLFQVQTQQWYDCLIDLLQITSCRCLQGTPSHMVNTHGNNAMSHLHNLPHFRASRLEDQAAGAHATTSASEELRKIVGFEMQSSTAPSGAPQQTQRGTGSVGQRTHLAYPSRCALSDNARRQTQQHSSIRAQPNKCTIDLPNIHRR